MRGARRRSAAATGATAIASAAVTVHGCIAASGGSAQATIAAAIAVRSRETPDARDFRIEDRNQTAFELRPVRHGERGAGHQGGVAAAAHDARDFEQLLCVVWTARPAGQDEVVARSLPFGPDMARGHPGERIEPVKGAGQLRDDVRQAVAALDVRELVQQDDPQPLERPSIRILGHDHRRREDPRRHRHRGASTFEEGQATRDVELGGQLHGERQPRCVDDPHGSTRQPLDGDEPDHQPSEDRARRLPPR